MSLEFWTIHFFRHGTFHPCPRIPCQLKRSMPPRLHRSLNYDFAHGDQDQDSLIRTDHLPMIIVSLSHLFTFIFKIVQFQICRASSLVWEQNVIATKTTGLWIHADQERVMKRS